MFTPRRLESRWLPKAGPSKNTNIDDCRPMTIASSGSLNTLSGQVLRRTAKRFERLPSKRERQQSAVRSNPVIQSAIRNQISTTEPVRNSLIGSQTARQPQIPSISVRVRVRNGSEQAIEEIAEEDAPASRAQTPPCNRESKALMRVRHELVRALSMHAREQASASASVASVKASSTGSIQNHAGNIPVANKPVVACSDTDRTVALTEDCAPIPDATCKRECTTDGTDRSSALAGPTPLLTAKSPRLLPGRAARRRYLELDRRGFLSSPRRITERMREPRPTMSSRLLAPAPPQQLLPVPPGLSRTRPIADVSLPDLRSIPFPAGARQRMMTHAATTELRVYGWGRVPCLDIATGTSA